MKKLLFSILFLSVVSYVSARDRQNIDFDWRFILADTAQFASPDYDDSHWRLLDLPHDWAIEGDFLVSNPSGASGGALPGGIAWYRKHITVLSSAQSSQHESPSQSSQRESPSSNISLTSYLSPLTSKETSHLSPLTSKIEFDGVYMNSTVYVNGQKVGFRPYGYSSFEYDITPYLHEGDNVIAVRVDNSDQPNSRWYSGCGIYRHVWLTQTHPVHVAHWGTHVQTTSEGKLTIEVTLDAPAADRGTYTVRNTVVDAMGKTVATKTGKVSMDKNKVSTMNLSVSRPRRWSVSDPYLYTVRTEVLDGKEVIDQVSTVTGFRSFRFDPELGFSLNGVPMKINGVCQHHDLGCLGAAISEDALHRQLVILRDMGVNAIRCSHNPPAPELLNMCDSMGFIVMDESFDMWRRRKTQNDYARFFDEWHERDLSDLILRDRNHPSILMWSIGNEVLEQWSSAEADTLTLEQANLILNAGHDASTLARDGEMSVNSLLTQHLADIVKRYDTTRPITAGCNEPDPANHLFKSGAIDIIGFNYHHQWVKDVPKNFPGKPFIFSESVSALQTRDHYRMPSDSIYKAPQEWWLPYTHPSMMCSAYDNMHASWSSTHEQTWDVVKHNDFVGGQFIWTGFDYIGEPTPYSFPARSSYFGIIDLAGFPKDVYYMYQSEWTDRDVLHLFPHWNHIPGDTIDMWCYYNHADEVELFINGQSQGTRRKALSHALSPTEQQISCSLPPAPCSTEYHVAWRVVFEPGEVRVVARKDGRQVGEQRIRTAGAPHHIRLTPDRTSLTSDGRSMAFVTVEVVDKDGIRCPLAENQIVFSVDGAAKIAGVDNGCQTSMERFKANRRRAFFGKCLVVLQHDRHKTGPVTLTARAADLQPATVTFSVK